MPGTQQLYCIILNVPDKLLVAETSNADSFKVVSIRKAEAENNNDDEDNDEKEEGADYEEDDHEEDETFHTLYKSVTIATNYWTVGCGRV